MKNISFLFCAFLSRFIITLFLSFFTITSVNASNKDVAISSSPSHPAKGINFFYLDGRDQEDLVQIAEKLFHGDDACKGTRPNISKRFENTLKNIKKRVLNGFGYLLVKIFIKFMPIDAALIWKRYTLF
ncbi:hypothetical protein [Alteromonas macleodii]|uniref:hypothetical protein n=1 Tax=Alteromonas macleodii TaxID=28108 RepID=UPI0001AEC563|nr:hypothetical protein [Alteromonas macleodii]AFS38836.1 hypothetical protein MASE_16720 [Alteromonas macleodii ATCC 27126]